LKDNEPRIDTNANELFSINQPVIRVNLEQLLGRCEIILSNLLVKAVQPAAHYLFLQVGRLEFRFSGEFSLEDVVATVAKFDTDDQEPSTSSPICLTVYASCKEHVNTCLFDSLRGRVQDLRLNFNQITTFDTSDSNSLNTLKTLHLECNLLSSVSTRLTKNLTGLVELKLTENRIGSLDVTALARLTRLQRLHLNDNELERLAAKQFESLTCLTELWLNSNRITSVDATAFTGLVNLKLLSVSDNKIVELDPVTFQGLVKLELLDLTRNQISQLDVSYFAKLESLVKLKLKGNCIFQKMRLALRSGIKASVET
jgi:hypothetical protein